MKKTSTRTASPLLLQRETLANLQGGGMTDYMITLSLVATHNAQTFRRHERIVRRR